MTFKQSLRKSPLRPIYLWTAIAIAGCAGCSATRRRRGSASSITTSTGITRRSSGLGKLSQWRLRRAQVFASVVKPGDRVLDLGVGDGALLQYLIEQRGIDGYGLDISPKAVDFCRAHGLNVALSDITRPMRDNLAEHFPEVDQFDYVILSEIIEHVPDPESLLDSLRPFVRQAIIVSIPNTGFHQHRLRLLLGRFPLQWVVTPGEHLRFWTLADFRWWTRQIGFKISAAIPYEGTPVLKTIYPSLFAARSSTSCAMPKRRAAARRSLVQFVP